MTNDLISRQAAIDAVYNCTDIYINNLPVMVEKKDAYKALAELPAAQPDLSSYSDKLWRAAYERGKAEAQPKRMRGKWIWKGAEGDSRHMCSVCKTKEYVPTCNGIPNIWQFCPNCGADMREG